MKVLHVIGARPQFVKAYVVSRALRELDGCREVIVHTGQHYDRNMSKVFFDELDLPEPDYNLQVGSGPHGAQTGAMLAGVESVLIKESPSFVIVYGDTNSTLAGALAAAKSRFTVAHVEAGLRSFRRDMPEEINRVVADHVCDILFAPTTRAAENLAAEGITRAVHVVGDVMLDAVRLTIGLLDGREGPLGRLGVGARGYALLTVHRAANVDDQERLQQLIGAMRGIPMPVIFPIHPRTRAALDTATRIPENVRITEPLGYLDMLAVERSARCILTDSGGVQKEAYFLGVPCVTLREETEWPETQRDGWNVLAGSDAAAIAAAAKRDPPSTAPRPAFGEGDSGTRIAGVLTEVFGRSRVAATP